ncbi:MAG: DUF2380 domain-containing protein, partial [Fibrobacteres bacterium]|nr:DUF2380 domain-containing protein [Fibrobacterota bacterium]
STLTAKFQDELFKVNKFQLMEQEKLNAILKEQGLEQSGCTQSACYVEIGKAVGVEQMLMGTVSKVGKITSITVKLIEVQTGRIIKSTVLDTDDKYEIILKKWLAELAEKIAGKESLGKSVYSFDASQKREPIAVLEITGNGVEKAETKGLSDRLRSELFNTGRFDVMEREQMEEILKEQGFQQSGVCDEASCLVQVGQLVGVTLMVGGSVTRIGDLYSVSARIIDVRSGRIIRTATADVKGNLETVLQETLQDVSRSLAGLNVNSRTNIPAWACVGGSVVLAGLGGYFTKLGTDSYNLYRNEEYDTQLIQKYRDETTIRDNISYGFYGGAAVVAGTAVYLFINKRLKLKVQNVALAPMNNGVKLAMGF